MIYFWLAVAALLELLAWWAFLDPNFALFGANRFVTGVIAFIGAVAIVLPVLWPIIKPHNRS